MRLQTSFFWATLLLPLSVSAAHAANPDQVTQLLSTKVCPGCDLSGADLVGADLTGAKLEGANLNAANLTGANLSGANLTRASLAGSNLVGTNLQRTILNETSFAYANLAFAQLGSSKLTKTDLQAANLMGADFLGAKVTKSSFIGANLYNLKNNRVLYAPGSGNVFQGQIQLIQIQEQESTSSLDRSAIEVEKPIPDTSPTFESGGTAPTRIFRRYRIPSWIGRPLRSTPGAIRSHHPDNLEIYEIW